MHSEDLLRFRTLCLESKAEYKSKGSRFLAFAYPVVDEEAVKYWQHILIRQHPKAVHVCYAYRLGVGPKELYHINDDGEPSGTAGRPILGQIDSYHLTNTVLFVVRYFGGVLLGVPGLIKAYKTVSKAALAQALIEEKEIYEKFVLHCDYAFLPKIRWWLKKTQSTIIVQELSQSCCLKVAVPLIHRSSLFALESSGSLVIKTGENN